MTAYPNHPGHKGGETSRAAAEAVAATAPDVRRQVMAAIVARPSTPEEIASAIGVDLYTVRPRCSELKAAGLIEDSGSRRATKAGKRAIVWRACAPKAEAA
jgi:predicted transcriptional regulator